MEEHRQVLQSQTSFYAATVGEIRQELLTNGAALSNLADSTKTQRREVTGIATFVCKHIEEHLPKSNEEDGGSSAAKTMLPQAF